MIRIWPLTGLKIWPVKGPEDTREIPQDRDRLTALLRYRRRWWERPTQAYFQVWAMAVFFSYGLSHLITGPREGQLLLVFPHWLAVIYHATMVLGAIITVAGMVTTRVANGILIESTGLLIIAISMFIYGLALLEINFLGDYPITKDQQAESWINVVAIISMTIAALCQRRVLISKMKKAYDRSA